MRAFCAEFTVCNSLTKSHARPNQSSKRCADKTHPSVLVTNAPVLLTFASIVGSKVSIGMHFARRVSLHRTFLRSKTHLMSVTSKRSVKRILAKFRRKPLAGMQNFRNLTDNKLY